MPDQAESLRKLVRASHCQFERPYGKSEVASVRDQRRIPHRCIVLVAGATSEVGATTFALHLALTWCRRSVSTSIVDANLAEPAIAQYCGLQPRATWQEVLQGTKTLREASVAGPSGLNIVACAPRRPTTEQEQPTSGAVEAIATPHSEEASQLAPHHPILPQLVRFASKQRVVVDVGVADGLANLLPIADHCIFVTGPDETSMLRCYASIKSVASTCHAATFWLVYSCPEGDDAAPRRAIRLTATCDQCLNLELSLAGQLPLDPTMASQSDVQRRSPQSAYSNAIDQVANRLATRMASQQAVALTEI